MTPFYFLASGLFILIFYAARLLPKGCGAFSRNYIKVRPQNAKKRHTDPTCSNKKSIVCVPKYRFLEITRIGF